MTGDALTALCSDPEFLERCITLDERLGGGEVISLMDAAASLRLPLPIFVCMFGPLLAAMVIPPTAYRSGALH